MKAIHNKIFIICAFLACMCACSNEDYLGGHYTEDGAGVQMSLTALPPDGETWAPDTHISISTGYATYDATARNRDYVSRLGDSNFDPMSGNAIYVKGTTHIVGYYPYVGTEGGEPAILLNTEDQEHVTQYYFAKSEEVSIANGSHVNLAFHHALAQLNLSIKTPSDEHIKGIRLCGFSQQAEVSPFTLEMKLSTPKDIVVTGEDIKDISFQLIPQSILTDAAIPAQLVLIGDIRSYRIDLGNVTLNSGEIQQGNIDVTNGVGMIEFVPSGSAWSDSGIGGNINSH